MKYKTTICAVVISLICIVASIGLVIYGNTKIIHTGIMDFKDPAAIAQAEIYIDHMLDQDNEKYIMDNYERILNQGKDSSTILVVETDGGLYQYAASSAQRLTVKEIIKCDDPRVTVGSEIEMFDLTAMNYYEGEIVYSGGWKARNILNAENTYLVFLDMPKASAYADTPYFMLSDITLSVINLDRTHALETCKSYNFNECRDVMHFISSEELAKLYNEMEEKILKEYGLA